MFEEISGDRNLYLLHAPGRITKWCHAKPSHAHTDNEEDEQY